MATAIRRLLLALTLIVASAAALAPADALADKIYLKDGTVLEGELGREGDTFIYITIEVGGVKQNQLVLKSTIERIERDDQPDAETESEPDPASETGAASAPAAPERESSPRRIDPDATKIAFLSLGEPNRDMVGPFLNAAALRESIELLEDDDPDIVVLHVNSGGGALSEVPRLRSVITRRLKPKHRTVVWVESAISAAAMTSITVEEIYFMPRGNFGAAVAFTQDSSGAQAVEGIELDQVLELGRELSREGRHDPLIMEAMQKQMDLSCDINEYGYITWREDLQGEHIVSRSNRILTFNALDAEKYGLSLGTASTKQELATLLQADEWVEVGQDAEEYLVEFRANVFEAQVEIGELFQKMQLAMSAGEYGRALRFLGELRSWARRAPSWTEYSAGGAPPLSDQFFREVERQINESRRGRR